MRKSFIVKFMTAISLFLMSFTLVFIGDKTIKVDAATNFAVVSDGSFDSLVAAVEKDNVEEVIITKTIQCNKANVDFILNGKNKIIRAEIIGVDESGMIQAGSEIVLINVIENANVTIKNVTILGGSKSAITNNGFLYLENVNVMCSGSYTTKGGIYNNSTGKLVMKNCNMSRNVGIHGGAIYNESGFVILDGCSLIENRSNERGGAIYCNSGKLIVNNTVIANNTAVSINGNPYVAGGLYANNCSTYIMNSTIVGNSSNHSTSGVGGVNVFKGKFYAVNNIITDNYALNNGVFVESDIIATLNNNTPNMFLYNNIYRVITTAGVTEESSNNYQLENKSSVEEIFASYQTSGNMLEDGSINPNAFEKPILVSTANGGVCVPTDKNNDYVENGVI